jgi:ABC-type sugar transport system ATPase subunit
MDDIFYVCDRVMALFHGRNFAEAPLSEVDRDDVISWIMGNRTEHGGTSPSDGPRESARAPDASAGDADGAPPATPDTVQ